MANDKRQPPAHQDAVPQQVPEVSAPISTPPAEPGEERMYSVGLKPNAPMEAIDVPTVPGYKAVSVPKYTSSLMPHPVNQDVMVLSPTPNLRGRQEMLFDLEYKAFMRYIDTHGFHIERVGYLEKADGTRKEVPSGTVVELNPDPKEVKNVRAARDQQRRVVPLADYVWIIPSADVSKYAGEIPTITQMRAKKDEK